MQQSPLELTRLNFEFGSRSAIDDLDLNTRRANAIAQLRSQIPLQLLAAELLDSCQQWPNCQLSASIGQQNTLLFDFIFRIPFVHLHLISPHICSRRSEEKFFPHGPETQEANAKFTLHPQGAILLELSLDGIA